VKCALCGNPILDGGEVAVEVKGWVSGPKRDSMRLRAETGRKAHEHCVTIVAAGQDPVQPDLFEPEGRLATAATQNTVTTENLEDML
jgi:hypothetical protein